MVQSPPLGCPSSGLLGGSCPHLLSWAVSMPAIQEADGGRGRAGREREEANSKRHLAPGRCHYGKQVLIKQAFAGCLLCSSRKYDCGSWVLNDKVREGLAEEVISLSRKVSGQAEWYCRYGRGDVHGQRLGGGGA